MSLRTSVWRRFFFFWGGGMEKKNNELKLRKLSCVHVHGIKVVGTYEKKKLKYVILSTSWLPVYPWFIFSGRLNLKSQQVGNYFAEWCKTSKNLEEVNVHQYFILYFRDNYPVARKWNYDSFVCWCNHVTVKQLKLYDLLQCSSGFQIPKLDWFLGSCWP